MNRLWLVLIVFGIVGCATVQYDSYVQPPSASAYAKSDVGFGPFAELMQTLSEKHQAAHISPFIPLNQIKGFRECYPLPKDEEIYAMVNTGLSADGCKAFVFTSKGVHSNPHAMSIVQGQSFFSYSTLYSPLTKYSPDAQGLNVNQGHINAEVNMPDNELYNIFQTARKRSKQNKYKSFKPPSKNLKIKTIPQEIYSMLEFSGMEGLYMKDEIPPNKETSFRRCADISDDVELLVYLDATFFGAGGCAGLAFLNNGILIHNTWLANHSGTYLFAYDYLFESDFVPYIKGIDLYIERNIGFDFSGTNLNGSPLEYGEVLLQMIKAFKGQIDISNEDALALASKLNKIPEVALPTYQAVSQPKKSKPSNYTVKQTKQNKSAAKKDEGMGFFAKLAIAAIGIYIASEIYDELSEDDSKPVRRTKPSSPKKGLYQDTSTEFAQGLLDRQRKINTQRAKEQQRYEIAEALFGVNNKICRYTINGVQIRRQFKGSCPYSINYEEPLMCYAADYGASPRCDIGKACGDTCIESIDTCHIGKGAACNTSFHTYP